MRGGVNANSFKSLPDKSRYWRFVSPFLAYLVGYTSLLTELSARSQFDKLSHTNLLRMTFCDKDYHQDRLGKRQHALCRQCDVQTELGAV